MYFETFYEAAVGTCSAWYMVVSASEAIKGYILLQKDQGPSSKNVRFENFLKYFATAITFCITELKHDNATS